MGKGTLRVAALLDEARRQTGLNDFGVETFREPLERLIDSYNNDHPVTERSDQIARKLVLESLVNRLEVEDWYRRHPEIDEQEILRPLFGVGMVRTGSTMLANMLMLDPDTRVLRRWESERLCPPPILGQEANDPRVLATAAASEKLAKDAPGLTKIQEIGANTMMECHTLMYLEFTAQAYEVFLYLPSYMEWLVDPKNDMRHTYAYHKRCLKLLQWRRPPTRWYLKCPPHMLFIDSLDAVYPDARFVYTHRDPLKVVPSISAVHALMRRAAMGENTMRPQIGAAQVERWAAGLERLEAFRARQPAARFHDAVHADIIADQLAEIRKLYAWAGWPLNAEMEAKVVAWRDDNPRDPHKPQLSDFGLTADDIRRRYAFYIEGRLAQVGG
jgi:hypothetical protein